MVTSIPSLRNYLRNNYSSLPLRTDLVSPSQLAVSVSKTKDAEVFKHSDVVLYSIQPTTPRYYGWTTYLFTLPQSKSAVKPFPKTLGRLIEALASSSQIHSYKVQQPQSLTTLAQIAATYKGVIVKGDPSRIASYSIIRIEIKAEVEQQDKELLLGRLWYIQTADEYIICIPSYYTPQSALSRQSDTHLKECFLCCLSLFKMSASDTYNEVMEVVEEKWEGVVTRKDVEEWEELNAGF